jgi:hypothetical protein
VEGDQAPAGQAGYREEEYPAEKEVRSWDR